MQHTLVSRLSFFGVIWALCVVVLGAYVRLSDAGLGCPDWPGCYGHIDVPLTAEEVARANEAFPERPVETDKAWKEMIHRYFASLLGLLILVIAFISARAKLPTKLPYFIVALVIFQGILGMWTVTLLVKPFVVTAHLFGGFATTALLLLLGIKTSRWGSALKAAPATEPLRRLKPLRTLAWGAFAALVMQIFLGGWVSTNYAALSCPDFPTCQGSYWPPNMDFADGFKLWRGLGTDYEGGVLANEARVAIHMSHRVWAIVAAGLLLALAVRCFRHPNASISRLGRLLGVLLALQLTLGVLNIVLYLPLSVATAHNGGAALLVLAMVALLHALYVLDRKGVDRVE